jgi:type IV secretion system protein VirB5
MKESDLTNAAEKYLEQYGEPLVMNIYLKITVLALCVISVALAALVYRSQNALAAMHPNDRTH